MAGISQEIELRLLLFAGAGLETARALVEGAAPRTVTSIYFDTSDHQVRGAGFTLRLREDEGRWTQTLKACGASLRRYDDERPASEAGLVLDALAKSPLARTLPKDPVLSSAFTTHLVRRSKTLNPARCAIEASLDEGEIIGQGRVSPILELELELKSGDPAALFDLARTLAGKAPFFLGFQSKSDRGYAMAVGEGILPTKFTAPAITRDMTEGDVFRVTARACLAHLAYHAALVAMEGLPDATHQARVALRRLRVAFRCFKGMTPKGVAAPLLRELRWLTRELEQARNLDVFRTETLEPALKAAPNEARLSDLSALSRSLETARARAYGRAEAACRSVRYRLFLIDAVRLIELEPRRRHADTAKKAERSSGQAMRRILKKRWRAVKHRAADVDWRNDKARHAFRIEAKRLRYAADIFASLATGEGQRRLASFLGALEGLQDSLGALNDMTVAKEVISLTVGGAPMAENAPDAGRAGVAALSQRAGEADAALRSAKRAMRHLLETPPWW